jgi:glycosyltransferase involved in cell wall biosynthesis
MRIIYYSPHPTHDIVSEVGYATHQREVIHALQNLGHEVLPVIMGGTSMDDISPITSGNYKASPIKKLLKALVPRILWTSLNNLKLRQHDQIAGQRLEQVILAFQPDLIYERSEYLQDSGALCASKNKIKYFLEVNAPFVEEMRSFEGKSLLETKAHQIEKFKLAKADKVITVSSALADFLIQNYNCDSSKIFVQANCINPNKININQDLVNELKLQFKPNNEKVIGFVGSMFPYHGVDMLIKAFAEVLNIRKDTILLIVGDGQILNNLKKMCVDLDIENYVKFTGKISHDKVFNYIETMDICIMAKSNWYGSPVKLFEYGLMNKPIIAPNESPVLDVMVHEKDAIIIDENIQSLSNAIQKLLNDSQFADTLANQFNDKVMTHYTWKHAALNIIKLCE